MWSAWKSNFRKGRFLAVPLNFPNLAWTLMLLLSGNDTVVICGMSVCCFYTVQVFFVDYGNTESVDVSQLLDLPSSFLNCPFQVCLEWIAGLMI